MFDVLLGTRLVSDQRGAELTILVSLTNAGKAEEEQTRNMVQSLRVILKSEKDARNAVLCVNIA